MNEEQQIIYIEILSQYNFNEEQKKEIRFVLENKLDVSIYAKPEFDDMQMFQIYKGLKKRIRRLMVR